MLFILTYAGASCAPAVTPGYLLRPPGPGRPGRAGPQPEIRPGGGSGVGARLPGASGPRPVGGRLPGPPGMFCEHE